VIAEELSDEELVERYRAGDEWAAAVLFRKYAPRLLSVARARCSKSFSSRFDPEDVIQAAFRSLFARLRNNPSAAESDVWARLLVLTLNKIRSLVEHHTAAKRTVRRTSSSDLHERPPSIPDRRANEIDAIDIREQVDALPEGDREVIRMRLDGYEVAEIATATGQSQRTVERILQSVRERMLSNS
jgi:RNA polymerase sigma-70 factor (ECF subfamily)